MNPVCQLTICEHLRREVEAVLAMEGFADAELSIVPAACSDLGGEHAAFRPCGRTGINCCYSSLVNRELIDAWLEQRCWLVTPGWLAHWWAHKTTWSFDPKTLPHAFAQTTSRIVLLDTGIEAQSGEQLREFANLVDRPCETFRVGLDVLSRHLKNLVLERRLKNQSTASRAALDEAQRKLGDYANAHEKGVEQLEWLTDELARKNRELENALYAVSHDLRSPLLNIQGFGKRLENLCGELCDLLQDPELPAHLRQRAEPILAEQIPKALRYIQSGAVKMDALIGGLLQLSRLGRVVLRCEALDMQRIVKHCIAVTAFQIQSAAAVVQAEPLPPCQGDSLLISQVFSNLLDNALKYREPSRPLIIRISGRTTADQAIYCVADNGIGIEPEHLEKIWELFFRLNPGGSTEGEGLGLNLVRRIVERNRGKVWVESIKGQGSSFFVALPKAEQSNSKAPMT